MQKKISIFCCVVSVGEPYSKISCTSADLLVLKQVVTSCTIYVTVLRMIVLGNMIYLAMKKEMSFIFIARTTFTAGVSHSPILNKWALSKLDLV